MSKNFFNSYFSIALLFILMLTHHVTARPQPSLTAHSLTITQPEVEEPEGGNVVEVEENCEGVGKEECLMRRTLAAHVDYIYTQKHNKP